MKERINAYFAVLIITIAGSGAAMIIIHVANADTSAFAAEIQTSNTSTQHALLKK
ncbi:MAG: hypothetical protein ACYCZZ_00065 [Minisyncoccota bacterium]